jgi:hypothetical protein
MSVFGNPRWLGCTIAIDKSRANELISKLKNAGVDATPQCIELRSEGTEIEMVTVPEEQMSLAQKIVRDFIAGR